MTLLRKPLNIQVGLPKTGTTTLQRDVFPEFSGYVCGTESRGPSKERTESLHRLYQVKGGHRDWTSANWREAAAEWSQTASAVAPGPLLVSLEGLFRWFDPQSRQPWPLMGHGRKRKSSRVGRHPLVDFLAHFQDAAPNLQIRVIFTIRNQPDFMGSLYAQLSYRMRSPSQKDMEYKVRDLASRKDPFFDWNSTIRDIESVVGVENTKIVVFEDGLSRIGQEIASFVDSTWTPSQNLDKRHNARSTSTDVWQLTTSRCGPIRKTLGGIGSGVALRDSRLIGDSLKVLRDKSGPSKGSAGVASIRMTTELRSAIQHAFSEGNQVLAERLGRDLAVCGY